MGRVTVRASAIGNTGTRLFTFLVDTGSTYVGLPQADIEKLGLPVVPGGPRKVQTATGIIEQHTYSAAVRLDGRVTPALVTEAPIPLIGYEILENLKMKVNPVTEELERAAEDEHMPPYLPFGLLLDDDETDANAEEGDS